MSSIESTFKSKLNSECLDIYRGFEVTAKMLNCCFLYEDPNEIWLYKEDKFHLVLKVHLYDREIEIYDVQINILFNSFLEKFSFDDAEKMKTLVNYL